MQNMWKKVGAALGSALMIGSTLVGAALAQETTDLGDYKDLMIASDGTVQGLYVVGAEAATADVVSAMDMTAWLGNQQVSGTGAGEGQITLTPQETIVTGVKRHVEFDNTAGFSYEFGASNISTDKIGPSGYASGDGVVDFLYSYKDKGPIYINGSEYQWNEEVTLNLDKINASRDDLESTEGEKYDEVFLSVDAQAIQYRYHIGTGEIANNDIKGKKIWFMGKEYTVISISEDHVKLGATDAEVVLSTANPSTTVGGVDVTLGGIYSASGNTYQAKITITNGGQTETKYIQSDNTDTIAGIEVYVKTAVVTTSGTNEGEAQMIIGAGVLKLTDGDYLEKGDGTETSWLIEKSPDTAHLQTLTVTESQAHNAITGDYPILSPGDSITSPNDLFALTYNGFTDKYGGDVVTRTINIQPELRDLNKDGTGDETIRIRTPDANYIEFTDAEGTTRTDNEIWINTSKTDNYYWRNETGTTVVYSNLTNPKIKLTTADELNISYNSTSPATPGYLRITEPELSEAKTKNNITIEYDGGKFQANVTSGRVYAYYGDFNNGSAAGSQWFGRATNYTVSTRDYYTKYGTYVSAVGPYLISLEAPEGQTYAEFIFGTQQVGEGTPITVAAGETTTIDGTKVKVEGAVSGTVPVTLPTSVAKTDAEVTSADKSAYTLVLVGGPAVNTLVGTLQTEGKLEKTIGSPGEEGYDIAAAGAGVVELVADAWGTGKYAIVVAGSDRAGTNAAANVLAHFDDYATKLDGQTAYTV